MECLRTFSFVSGANEDFGTTKLNVWGLAPQNYWNVRAGGSSTFNIEGFKNINIYKIQAVGNIGSLLGTGNGAIVQDWEFVIRVNGNQATIGNNISSTNAFTIGVQDNNPIISISKYNPSIEFISPIQSVKSIQIFGINAFGIGAQNITTPLVNLSWNLTFVCHYMYEGEEFAFL